VQARVVFNAAGPWTDEIARLEDPRAGPAVRGTKGVHIAVPAARVGNLAAVTMLSPDDGRVMFTLPSGTHTIIGTTDTVSSQHPHEVRASRTDVRYLLSAANRFFPAAALSEDDVVAAWAGIRPLVARTNTGDPASASREHAITRSRHGVLAVTGGKLTTFRAMAEQCVDAVVRSLGRKTRRCDTMDATLEAPRPAAHLDDAVLVPGLPWRETDVVHAVREELAETIGDVLIRRTTLAFETRDHGRSVAPLVAAILGAERKWTDAGVADALAEYEREVKRIFAID
jgi:glycerol-3-phosphate dehydrogenase